MPPRGNFPRPPMTSGPHPLSRRTRATPPTRVTQRNLVTQRTPLTQRSPVTRRRRRRRRHRPSPTTQHTQHTPHTPHTLSFRQLQCAPSAAESGVSLAPSRLGLSQPPNFSRLATNNSRGQANYDRSGRDERDQHQQGSELRHVLSATVRTMTERPKWGTPAR